MSIPEYIHFKDITPHTFLNSLRTAIEANCKLVTRDQAYCVQALKQLDVKISERQAAIAAADPSDLALPLLDNFWFGRIGCALSAHGDVTGHLILGTAYVTTSVVVIWDEERELMATWNTVYRTGRKVDLSTATPLTSPAPNGRRYQ